MNSPQLATSRLSVARVTTRTMSAALLFFAAALISGAAQAQENGYVGIYADAQGTIPCTAISQGTGTTLYVVATLAGSTANGITAAEFRVEISNPSGWFFSYAAPTGSIPLGNIFDTNPSNPNDGSGIDLAFSSCLWHASGKVSLGTISVYNATGSGTSLAVKRHSSPSNAGYICPLFVSCDGPTYSMSCMSFGSEPACDLSKTVLLGSSDPAVFVAGLNIIPGDVGGNEGPHPMREDPLVKAPLLVEPQAEPDIIGIDGTSESGKTTPARVAVDTTWIADYSFDGAPGLCNLSGWTTKDNLIRSDSPKYWNVNTHYAGDGYIVNKAAELRLEGCWTQTGYGNGWDQGVKLKYKGSGVTLSFDFLSDSEFERDFVSIEADSAGASNSRVDYLQRDGRRWPSWYRRILHVDHGSHLSGRITGLELPDFGAPSVEHTVYIRFASDSNASDEDGLWLSEIHAGLVVDNITVTGGAIAYSENFEGGSLNPNIDLINSGRSKPFGDWARLFLHVTDNDKCNENTTCSWLFTDPVKTAYFNDMSFGPGNAVIRNWLDDVVISPWITLNPSTNNGLVLTFREFGGNRFAQGRIARSIALRGLYNGTCTTKWYGDDNKDVGLTTWTGLDVFRWTSYLNDLSPFFDKNWEKVQVRYRVADWQALASLGPPANLNPGPGPYLDRVRLGRIPVGPYIYIGPDTRFQAQDAFPTFLNAISPGEHFSPTNDRFGTCAFSMAHDIGMAEGDSPGSPNLITGDSIVIGVIDLGGAKITKVGFYYRVVAGPHVGKKVDPNSVLLANGLCKSEIVYSPGFVGFKMFGMDFDDTYFRGGDVLQYFWYVENDALAKISFPPGINTDPGAGSFTIAQAEALTGGLMEVNFLPTINWASNYLNRIANDPGVGDLEPTALELANSSQKSCVLYMNKVNTARRSGLANRTSFMYTLDRLGYRGYYDVYDIQGSGNTNNDLGGRASVQQASGYALIVHDVGRSAQATIPDGSDWAMQKINQAQWYRDYLSHGRESLIGTATLWVIGENWAFENKSSPLVLTDMSVGVVAADQGIAVSPEVKGEGAFTFWNGASAVFTNDMFRLAGGCPVARDYDAVVANGAATRTHRYVQGTVTGPGAVVFSKNVPLGYNTVAMTFNWFDMYPYGQPTNPDEQGILATKIVNGVLPSGCQRQPSTAILPDEGLENLPRVTSLHQNVPNPCNPHTRIAFELAQDEETKLRIYDIAGHLVRTLVAEKRPRGAYSVAWDGTDEGGFHVASGVYVYRLQAGRFSATRKLLVIK